MSLLATPKSRRLRLRFIAPALAFGALSEIDVTDDGPGVPPSISAKIFDPFFTTRPPGEGTGIGLSLSAQMVSDWGGELTLEPASEGAHFKILIAHLRRRRPLLRVTSSARRCFALCRTPPHTLFTERGWDS